MLSDVQSHQNPHDNAKYQSSNSEFLNTTKINPEILTYSDL